MSHHEENVPCDLLVSGGIKFCSVTEHNLIDYSSTAVYRNSKNLWLIVYFIMVSIGNNYTFSFYEPVTAIPIDSCEEVLIDDVDFA